MAHSHFMNLALAVKYGTNESLFLTNLCFWIEKNKANRVNYHDGHYWVYNTMEAWAELFPYFSKDQIRRLINKMKSQGILSVGVYNRFQYDRTQWYSVSDEVMALYLGVFRKEERGKGGQRNGMESREEALKTPEGKNGNEPAEPAGEEPSICPEGPMDVVNSSHGSGGIATTIPYNKPHCCPVNSKKSPEKQNSVPNFGHFVDKRSPLDKGIH